jgi:hypothetical protein
MKEGVEKIGKGFHLIADGVVIVIARIVGAIIKFLFPSFVKRVVDKVNAERDNRIAEIRKAYRS